MTVTKHCSSDANQLQAVVESWCISRPQGKKMWVLGDPSQTFVQTKVMLESIQVTVSGALANILLASGA